MSGEGYVRVVMKFRQDDPLLDYIMKNASGDERLGKVAKRLLKRLMVIDRVAHENKRLASEISRAYHRARQFGVAIS